MHVLFITDNKKFLEEKSGEQAVLNLFCEASDELHAIVLCSRNQGYVAKQLTKHAWVYPVHSIFPLLRVFRALRVIRRQLFWQRQLHVHIVLSDSPFLAGWIGVYIAWRYDRVWMVNIHDYFWKSIRFADDPFARVALMPAFILRRLAFRICVFSERVRIYLSDASRSDEQRAKLFSMPAMYDTEKENISPIADIKQKYPDFTFIILVAAPGLSANKEHLLLNSLFLLRKSYMKAGLVVTGKRPHIVTLWRAWRMGLWPWVKFERSPSHLESYMKTANVFLHMASDEHEEESVIQAAAVSTPIIALESVVSKNIIKDGVNGILIETPSAEAIVSAILMMNESTMRFRENFKVNAGLFLYQNFVLNRGEFLKSLRELLSYEEAPPEEPDEPTSDVLLQKLPTRPVTVVEEKFAELKDKLDFYTGKTLRIKTRQRPKINLPK